jgi:hypothetical protein
VADPLACAGDVTGPASTWEGDVIGPDSTRAGFAGPASTCEGDVIGPEGVRAGPASTCEGDVIGPVAPVAFGAGRRRAGRGVDAGRGAGDGSAGAGDPAEVRGNGALGACALGALDGKGMAGALGALGREAITGGSVDGSAAAGADAVTGADIAGADAVIGADAAAKAGAATVAPLPSSQRATIQRPTA